MAVPKSPILVTGAHRSGTTWVGRTLAAAPMLGYIHEPFSLSCRPGICSAPVEHWYHYVHSGNEHQFYPAVCRTLGFHYSLIPEFRVLTGPRDLGRMARDASRSIYLRHVARPRPLVKDPFALFSAEFYAKRFLAKIVMVVRHPAAYVNSILKRGWSFDFGDWQRQDALMGDLLSPLADEIGRYAGTHPPLLDQATLLWRATHSVVSRFHSQNPSWILCRHEDLSRDPLRGFSSVFAQLNLAFTPKVRRFIIDTTSSTNPASAQRDSVLDVKRNSAAVVRDWKHRLTSEEIHRIRESTEEESSRLYAESDWDEAHDG